MQAHYVFGTMTMKAIILCLTVATFSQIQATQAMGAQFILTVPATCLHCLKTAIFLYNESGNDGGAMNVNEHNVVLASCLFAQNETEEAGGAIYVNGSYSINVKGLMIIKDNKSLITSTTKTRYGTHNLCLNGRAMLYSGGLYEGSYIGISKFSQGSNDEVAEGIAEYQQKYFHSDQKNIKFEKTGTVDTPIITTQSNETASVFGTGSVVVIVSVAVAALAAGLAALAVKKKKGVAENGNDENE